MQTTHGALARQQLFSCSLTAGPAMLAATDPCAAAHAASACVHWHDHSTVVCISLRLQVLWNFVFPSARPCIDTATPLRTLAQRACRDTAGELLLSGPLPST